MASYDLPPPLTQEVAPQYNVFDALGIADPLERFTVQDLVDKRKQAALVCHPDRGFRPNGHGDDPFPSQGDVNAAFDFLTKDDSTAIQEWNVYAALIKHGYFEHAQVPRTFFPEKRAQGARAVWPQFHGMASRPELTRYRQSPWPLPTRAHYTFAKHIFEPGVIKYGNATAPFPSYPGPDGFSHGGTRRRNHSPGTFRGGFPGDFHEGVPGGSHGGGRHLRKPHYGHSRVDFCFNNRGAQHYGGRERGHGAHSSNGQFQRSNREGQGEGYRRNHQGGSHPAGSRPGSHGQVGPCLGKQSPPDHTHDGPDNCTCGNLRSTMQCDAQDIIRPHHERSPPEVGEVLVPHNNMFRTHVGWLKVQLGRSPDQRQPVWALFNKRGTVVFISGRNDFWGKGEVMDPLRDELGEVRDLVEPSEVIFLSEYRHVVAGGMRLFKGELGRRTLLGICRFCGPHPDARTTSETSFEGQ